MKITLKNMAGENVGEVELKETIFAAPVNTALMHQALTRQLANARRGTAKTKTRGEVSGSTRKMWRQKNNARTAHGPQFARGDGHQPIGVFAHRCTSEALVLLQ